MKALKIYMTMGLLLVSSLAMAQITRISGTVSDDFDVLPGVNVVEIDASNRMVNATVTDMNGNFVLPVKSQKNKVKFSYMGFKTITLPINKTVFKVKMEENAKQMTEVQVTAKKKLKTSGLAIPEREVSFSAQSLSAKEFALLEYMIRNKGVVLSRESIENNLLNYGYSGGSNVVDVYISYLRRKIDSGFPRKLIHPVWGTGWVLREEE
jgi:hypothetical protein